MAVSPQYVGGYGQPWPISLNTDSGADDLTSIGGDMTKVSVKLKNTVTGVTTTSTGAITQIQASPAQISWQPTSADFAVAGEFEARVWVTFPSPKGPTPYDPIPSSVLP